MEFTHTDMRQMIKSIFSTKLNKIYDEFINNGDIILKKESVTIEFKKKKEKENKKEQIKKVPLVGESIYRMLPRNYKTSSDRCKFILSLMDNLKLEYIDIHKMQQIMENRDEIYEEYYCRDYEYEFSAKLAQYIAYGYIK